MQFSMFLCNLVCLGCIGFYVVLAYQNASKLKWMKTEFWLIQCKKYEYLQKCVRYILLATLNPTQKMEVGYATLNPTQPKLLCNQDAQPIDMVHSS